MSQRDQEPKVTAISELPTSEAKWVTLKKINYTDVKGRHRVWEATSRKTQSKAGVDVAAMGTIILHPSRPPSTILVLQYRPPVDATTIEWPAGLINADERPQDAGLRELREETGYTGRVLDVSPVLAFDPGMTSTNLQLVMVEVKLTEDDAEPEQHLDDGEYIKRVVVPLDELYDRLLEYSKQPKTIISAKLFHWAAGLHFAKHTLPHMQ